MKNKKSLIAIILVLFLTIGVTFAYFTTTGTFTNLFNLGNYSIVTEEVFESPDNWSPGDFVEKTVTARNNGTVNAAVRIKLEDHFENNQGQQILNSGIPNDAVIINFTSDSSWTYDSSDDYYYYNYILSPNQVTDSLLEGVTLNPSLAVANCTEENGTKTCRSNVQGINDYRYILKVKIETVQADKYKNVWNTDFNITEKPIPAITILSGNKGNLQAGDMVAIGDTEDFYVLSSDNSENGKTLLLAKYNLLVGEYDSNGNDLTQIPTTTPGYGLQSIDAIGGYALSEYYGAVIFSEDAYWDDGNENVISPYNANGANYFGNPFPYVYDNNSEVYNYISGSNGYVNKLIEMGAPASTTGRLLSYEESELYQDVLDEDKSIIKGMGQSYWFGSVLIDGNRMCLWGVSGGDEAIWTYGYDGIGFGIRPVIEIPTDVIK